MKGRRVRDHHVKGAPAAADLLVCFPSRAHLSLMPKPICSPARPSEPNKRQHHLHRLKKSATRGSAGQASPLMWAKAKSLTQGGPEMVSEPTSPKVTCAGQIKVRHKAGTCKSWQSVMEEIEKIHMSSSARNKQRKPRTGWADTLGFKKEVMQFLTCLRTIRFDFRCFGSFHAADITTDDEDEEDEEEEDVFQVVEDRFRETAKKPQEAPAESSRTVFSKWFMVLQEEQNNQKLTTVRTKSTDDDLRQGIISAADGDGDDAPAVPPPNALLLMRCRSAPAKSWLEEREEEEEEEEEEEVELKEEEEEVEDGNEKMRSNRSLRYLMDEDEKRKTKESVVVMRYQYYEADSDSYKFSSDIAKETWVVGGVRDPLSRSRSWKR